LNHEELPVFDIELVLERQNASLREADEVMEDLIGHPLS